MRTKKRKPVALDGSSPASAPDAIFNQETENNENDAREKGERLSFYLSPDGVPAWDRMVPQTREKLTELLRNKLVQEKLGFSPERAKDIGELGFGEDEANALLDLLGGIDSIAAAKIYKVPIEITRQAFSFSPDHRKKVNPPLIRVMNKWGPALLKTYKDEIGVAIVMSAILNSQLQVMRILEEKRKRNSPQPVPPRATPPPVAEMPTPKQPEEKQVDKSDDILENAGFNVS